MKQQLNISAQLSLPLDTVTNAIAILARRRVGKSYTEAVIAEEMCAAGLPWVALDPTGVGWGLGSSADGKQEGLPVVVVGGPHAHIPLEPTAGKIIANMVVDNPGWYVIDFSRFDNDDEIFTFSAAFGKQLYWRHQRKPSTLHLFLDEADLFVPQKPVNKNHLEVFKAYDKIVRRGGVYGLGVTLISQRPAVINKDVLTQCETLIALRTSAPLDQDPIFDWVGRNGTKEQLAEIKKSLASLEMGQAWYFSPDAGIFKVVQIRKRHTFNSSATPTPGAKAIEPKVFSRVDLDKLGEQIKATVEKAKHEDADYLNKRVRELERQLADRPEPVQVESSARVEFQTVEVPVLSADQYESLMQFWKSAGERALEIIQQEKELHTETMHRLSAIVDDISAPVSLLESIRNDIAKMPSRIDRHPSSSQLARQTPKIISAPKATKSLDNDKGISYPQKRILDALVWLESVKLYNPRRTVIAFLAGQSPKSSGYTNNLGFLRSAGLIIYPNAESLAITDDGRELADKPASPADSKTLQAMILNKLPRPQARILEILIAANGRPVDRTQLALDAGQSPTSSGFTNNLGALRSLGVIDYPNAQAARALEVLWV
jgi:uncharacterized protein